MDMSCIWSKLRYKFFLILSLLLLFSLPVHAASVFDGFNPDVNGSVYTSAAQADGKLLIGGAFTKIGDQTTINHIARLNTDGSLDTTFNPDINGNVYSIVVQSDGKILVGGAFTAVGGQPKNCIARLNNDGSADGAFTSEANNTVRTIALLLNGDIIIGGDFTTINSEDRKHIARLSTDNGSLDSEYRPDADGVVYSLATQRNGKVIVGGSFTHIGGQARNYIARLNDIDGSAETTAFNISANGIVRTIVIQTDNKVLIGGDFTILTDPHGPYSRNYIALLDEDGDTDFNFDPDANGSVYSIVLQTDGEVLVGGNFASIGGLVVNRMARLNIEFGYADSSFVPNVNGIVHSILVQVDDKIVVGGEFTSLLGEGRNHLARLNTDGSVEVDFALNNVANNNDYGTVYSTVQLAGGQTLVGGRFTEIGGEEHKNLARLNSDGTVDESFTVGTNGLISSIVVEAGGTILVGGEFTTIGDYAIPYLARLYADGSVDPYFAPQPNSAIHTLAIQNDSKIIVGGRFTIIGGLAQKNLARLYSSGAGDAGYAPSFNGPVYALVVQGDGKLVAGGDFTEPGSYITRLKVDGEKDDAAIAAPDKAVRALAIQADGSILVGGDFTTINGKDIKFFVRLSETGTIDPDFSPEVDGVVRSIAVQANTNILIGGDFTTITGQARNFIARLFSIDGTVDAGFGVNANAIVRSIVAQNSGDILVGGDFTAITDGFGTLHGRGHIVRLSITGTVDSAFTPDAKAIYKAAISAIASQGNGKYLIGGLFSHIDGVSKNHMARLYPNGTLDNTWATSSNGEITSIVIQSNGKILICGNFTSVTDRYDTYPRNSLARLNTNGTVDLTFDPIVHGHVYAIVEETSLTNKINGDLLLAGDFTTITMDSTNSDRPFMARLKNGDSPDENPPTLSLDSFNSSIDKNPDAIVRTIAIQNDSKILIGGDFAWIGIGVSPRSKMARLDQSGISDPSFDPNANGTVRSIVVQPDGYILVGGDFTYIGNQTRNKMARLSSDSAKADEFHPNANASVHSIAIQTDGKIFALGEFTNIGTKSRSHIARLEPVLGTADEFDVGVNPLSSVSSIALQTDGKIVIGGDFTAINSQNQNMIARMSADNAALQELTFSIKGTTLSWHRSQSLPEVHDVVFYESANNTVWGKIPADATRVADGWELVVPSGNPLFVRQNRYIAVSAKTSGGFVNGSTSSIQSVRQYFIDYYTLAVTPPTGGVVISNLEGIDCGGNCSKIYQADTGLTLTASPYNNGYVFGGGTDYVFTKWGGVGMDCGTGTTNPMPVLMDKNRSCTANFSEAHISLLGKAGNGGGTVDWDPINRIDGLAAEGKVYESGNTAYLTAVADDDSIFTGWSGDCNSGENGFFELLMDADKSCTATFEPKQTLTITPIGEGTVTGAGEYATGTMVELTAVPNEGYFFNGWSGGCTGIENPLYLLMDGNKTCNAHFSEFDTPIPPQSNFSWSMFLPSITIHPPEERILTTSINGLGIVTSSDNFINCPYDGACSHNYTSSETVTLTATPLNDGVIFTGWLGTDINCPGTGSCTLTMDLSKEITAQFQLRL